MADEVNWSTTLGGSKDGVTIAGSVTDNQDLDGDVLYSNTLTLTTTATYEKIVFPAGLIAEGICGVLLFADPTNEAQVVVASSGTDPYAFATLLVGGLPALWRPYLDAAAGDPSVYVKSAWSVVAAKVKIVAVGQEEIP